MVKQTSQFTHRRSSRLMVVGIPNVGKSTIINRLVRRFAVRTGERAGITRGSQWIRLRDGWEMLDTPGFLPPYIKSNVNAKALAAIGCIDFKVVDEERTAKWLLKKIIARRKFSSLAKYYSLSEEDANKNPAKLLDEIGVSRGCFKKGGRVDRTKAAQLLLRDFRRGELGRLSLEKPEDYEET